jgi:hypothetical protein
VLSSGPTIETETVTVLFNELTPCEIEGDHLVLIINPTEQLMIVRPINIRGMIDGNMDGLVWIMWTEQTLRTRS